MMKLIDEVDPKRVNGKHMAGKQILIREKEEVFLSKVVLIADIPYVYKWGTAYRLDQFDGWAPIPVYELDQERELRRLDSFFSED